MVEACSTVVGRQESMLLESRLPESNLLESMLVENRLGCKLVRNK
jgi:hypothetical protein